MSKDRGILLDPQTGDIMISEDTDSFGLIELGLVIGEVTYQNQAIILQAHPGEFKENPTLGIGIADILHNEDIIGWKREIMLQLESDGMKVNDVGIDIKLGKLSIDASYSS